MDLQPGQAIGPYHIVSQLGRGGMGAVYLAQDQRLRRNVALKFLHADSGAADDERRLLREARAASALNHPNICQVFDVSGGEAASWIAMEYVEGQPLSAMIPAGGVQPDTALRIAKEIAAGLGHAHQRGILHRDLKPSNIVCDAEGHPKILDFGISGRLPHVAAREMTRTGTAVAAPSLEGSLPYMAPEVLRGGAADERSDLWSLGALLYELLTGALPFRGGNSLEVAAAILESPIPPLPPHVPAPLARIVMRLLARVPAERYGSAAEVGAALDVLSRPAKPQRLHRRLVIAACAIAVATAAGFLVLRAFRFRPLTLSEQRLVSTAEAPHRAPSYSPDGSMIALVAPDAAGVPQIRVADLARGTSIVITAGSVPTARPRWSPKGDQIVYALEGQGIWSVSPLGGTPRRILAAGFNPNLSSDAKQIVYENRRELWIAASDGSQARKLEGVPPLFYGVPRGPAFSPDGKQIAFFQAEAGPNGDLWVVPAEGGAARRLTWDLREGGWPVWTPDGRAIVYSSARAGSRTLWQIPAKGGSPFALTTGAGADDQPDVSSDGRQVTYTNVRNSWDLRVRNLATGDERSLLQRGVDTVFPMFSPDGRRIVFFGRADYAVAIFTINADGSDLRQLTAGRELNHQPRWGPDGTDVYFFQITPEQSFRRIPSLGGPSVAFKPWEWTTTNAPHFDPAGRFIAFVRQRAPGTPTTVPEHTVIHEIGSGREQQWPEPHVHPTGWSHDSQSIVGWRHDGTVVICAVADGNCRVVAKGSVPVWPLGGARIYFARPASSTAPQELWSVSPDGADERFEAQLGTFRAIDRFFTVSRDGLAAWARFDAGRDQIWTATVDSR